MYITALVIVDHVLILTKIKHNHFHDHDEIIFVFLIMFKNSNNIHIETLTVFLPAKNVKIYIGSFDNLYLHFYTIPIWYSSQRAYTFFFFFNIKIPPSFLKYKATVLVVERPVLDVDVYNTRRKTFNKLVWYAF